MRESEGEGAMNRVAQTESYLKEKFKSESSGHDWAHIHRVYRTSLQILAGEAPHQADKQIVSLGALLHDIADWKFHHGDESAGPRAAAKWLKSLHTDETTIQAVCTMIKELSFKGAGVQTPMSTLEGKIVQDADRLDALGAVGIARAFSYGGFKHRMMFDPGALPHLHQTAEQYKAQQSTTVNHFFEKLLLLRDRMNTETARKLAEERHRFMVDFLDRFFAESHETESAHVRLLQTFCQTENDS
jgi:uncharacterized protein